MHRVPFLAGRASGVQCALAVAPVNGGAAVSFTATATDNCDANPGISCTPSSGSTFHLGTSTVTCTATDASGNINFNMLTPAPIPAGRFISATATNPANETSEFSQVRTVVQANQAPVANADAYSISEDGTKARASQRMRKDHGTATTAPDAPSAAWEAWYGRGADTALQVVTPHQVATRTSAR